MKARFNYDLSEVKELLLMSRQIQQISPQQQQNGQKRFEDRQELVRRAEELTRLMEIESTKARGVFSNMNAQRVAELLRRN